MVDATVAVVRDRAGPHPDGRVRSDARFTDGNIGGFAQASDDTRAVINFMHAWPVPVDFVTPVPCEPSGDITYDVSISDVSGLQVPTKYRGRLGGQGIHRDRR